MKRQVTPKNIVREPKEAPVEIQTEDKPKRTYNRRAPDTHLEDAIGDLIVAWRKMESEFQPGYAVNSKTLRAAATISKTLNRVSSNVEAMRSGPVKGMLLLKLQDAHARYDEIIAACDSYND